LSKINILKFENKDLDDLELLEFKSKEDEAEYNELLKNEYIQRKCANRKKRIKDIKDYIISLAPEILSEGNRNLNNLLVIDIGPGPGELLEVARNHGYNHLGYDALIEDCEMGNEYIRYSYLMSKRQNLNIEYCDFYKKIGSLNIPEKSTALINSRGSIEQVFRSHLEGIPHKQHKDAQQLSWIIDDKLKEKLILMFEEFCKILVINGVILIHGNGAKNVDEYHQLLSEIISNIEGLNMEATDGVRLHKIRRIK